MTEITVRFNEIVTALGGEVVRDGEAMACCPAHDDRTPSMKLDLRNGKILAFCYAGCPQDKIISELRGRGLWTAEMGGPRKTPPGVPLLWPPPRMLERKGLKPGPDTQKQFVQHWVWRDENGQIIGLTALYTGHGKKDVIPFFKKYNEQKWSSGFPDDRPRPLFARDVISAAPGAIVWIVEGERKAELLIKNGEVATTWPGGARSWGKVDYSMLRNRRVRLWPDKDAPGLKAMAGLADWLSRELDCPVETVDVEKLEDMPAKGDVVDWFELGHAAEELKNLPVIAGEKKNGILESVPDKDRPYSEYEQFFIEKLGPARKDIFSGDVMTFDENEGVWLPIDTEANLFYLRSQAMIEKDRRLKIQSIKDHFYGTYLRSKHKEFIPEIPTWDGVDYIQQFAESVEIRNVSTQCFYEYICQWGALMFSRIFNPMIQNQILVLQGDEGAGKSTFVYTLTKGLGQWANNFTVHTQEKDNYEQVASSAVLILDEFERLSKHEQGLVKNLITTPRQRYRPSHERKHQTKAMRASWISTTNPDEILKSSGKNRRYIIFEIGAIKWDYPTERGLQILSQWKKLSDEGYRVTAEARSEMEDYIRRKTPLAFWDEVIGDVLERVESYRQQNDQLQTKFSNEELDRVFERVNKEYGTRPARLKKELQNRGFSKKYKKNLKSIRGWEFPIIQEEESDAAVDEAELPF